MQGITQADWKKQCAEVAVRFELESKYLSNGGTRCPFCGSIDITGGPVETGSGMATQPMSCDSCEASWRDDYDLIGIKIVSFPEEHDVQTIVERAKE